MNFQISNYKTEKICEVTKNENNVSIEKLLDNCN